MDGLEILGRVRGTAGVEGAMERQLGRFAPHAYAIMRMVLGFLFACHGAQKLFGVLGGASGQPGSTVPVGGLMWFGGVIELAAGVLMAFGLFTSLAAFVASGEMAVAYFMVHQKAGPLPIQNHGELAVVYCFVFLYVATRGDGIWSLAPKPAIAPARPLPPAPPFEDEGIPVA
jgi:putative oxidoreductase